ncbi:hypothetical protein FNV43_RR14120 [Rhamnella rubrinervis]|uniref:Dirigent protein n=1 Tax=Rhamnella rubrinervis TaxID=2594499 RepID=A0A8K0MG47_9ROSA|nr:hypothetical protein FNV43_RR14120 [Rhamnella rubrinervis]
MARILPILILSILSYSLAITLASATDGVDDDSFVRAVDRKLLGLKKKEKLSHFRFYWHDIYSGRNPTAMPIIPASNASKTGFGGVSMIDDPLTQGPELTSKLLGRAQGFYAQASLQEVGLLMAMNFVFVTGKYNGSTISILGRNPVFNKVRELPVIGGSGLFRFARGYAQASTHKFTPGTGDATVEYNVYLLHY